MVEWISITVDGKSCSRPIDWVKIRWELSEGRGAVVLVDSSGFRQNEDGQITAEEVVRLLDYGERKKINVRTGEDDYARMVESIQESKYGKPVAQVSDDLTRWVDEAGNPVEFDFPKWCEDSVKKSE